MSPKLAKVAGAMTVEESINLVWQACQRAYRDRNTTIAAGVAFFILLATVPGIAALVCWLTTGSGVASLLWLCCSILFEWVVSGFGSFDELYGSLSAMIGFMIWIWLSTIIVLFGAELDAAARRRNGSIHSRARSDTQGRA